MDDFKDPFDLPDPPWWSEPVRCRVCGQTYDSHELYLNPDIDEYCCREWPVCQGCGTDIIWLGAELGDDEPELGS